jgi:hypothetical protein
VNSRDTSGNPNSLSNWHFGDNYDQPPVLTPTWKLEIPDYLDNSLAIQSDLTDQFLMDIQHSGIKVSTVDPMGKPTLA